MKLPLRIDRNGVGSQTDPLFKLGSQWLIVDADGNYVDLYAVIAELNWRHSVRVAALREARAVLDELIEDAENHP